MVRLEPGDRVVLVTDGTTETLEDRDLVTILDSHPSSLDAAEALVRSAVSRGTRDDATSVVLDVVVRRVRGLIPRQFAQRRRVSSNTSTQRAVNSLRHGEIERGWEMHHAG